MSDFKALTAAVVANPAEDTPRLVLADWLQEHGGTIGRIRADFIRIQVEAHRLCPPPPMRFTDPERPRVRTLTIGTGIGSSQMVEERDPDPLAGLSDEDRRRREALQAQEDEIYAAVNVHALLGIEEADCLLSGSAEARDAYLPETHQGRSSTRRLSTADLRRGSRRGFLGAMMVTQDIWEASYPRIRLLWPVEEVDWVGIPHHAYTHEALTERWPGIRFNPTYPR